MNASNNIAGGRSRERSDDCQSVEPGIDERQRAGAERQRAERLADASLTGLAARRRDWHLNRG